MLRLAFLLMQRHGNRVLTINKRHDAFIVFYKSPRENMLKQHCRFGIVVLLKFSSVLY